MTKTVYLHIGWGRCGSSSIQHFAERNRDQLRERGVFYPSAVDMNLPHTRGGNAQSFAEPEDRRASIDITAEYIAQSPDDIFLLSSEFLFGMAAKFLRLIKDQFAAYGIDVVCVAYIREQREWLVSRYAQALKSRRWTLTLNEYLQERYQTVSLNYFQKFEMLTEVFGRDRLLVRLFERNKMSGRDVRVDIFDLMNVDVRDMIEDEPTANASPSVLELETMRAVNFVLPVRGFNHREFLRRSALYIEAHDWQPCGDVYRLADPSLMREIGQFYEASNESFRQEFFPELEAPLLRTKIPDDYEMLEPGEQINAQSVALLLNYFLELDDFVSRVTGNETVALETSDAKAAPAEKPLGRFDYL